MERILPTTAARTPRRFFSRPLVRGALCAAALLGLAGCSAYQAKPPAPMTKYQPHPSDPTLPVFLKGTIRDLAIVGNIGNFPVSSWGLVVGLRGTGDSTCPSVVHEWMVKEMQVHLVGSHQAGFDNISPDEMLSDPHVAVVGVIAYIPPGARKGDYIDAIVQAMPGNNTTSLANGMLYRTDLKINGLSDNPIGAVNTYAKAQGDVFVNPVYAVNEASSAANSSGGMRVGLRAGVIPGGALVDTDRPIHLVLRMPSWSTSRAIEGRINQRFPSNTPLLRDEIVASAQDEGYIRLMVPRHYRGDWEHFVGVVTHLYLNPDPSFSAIKARQLAAEAVKPKAPLLDISYAFEALGPSAIPSITPLLSDPHPDVQFAAARAAAFLGDSYGVDRLMQIASTSGHEFQLNAVDTLGKLPDSQVIDAKLSKLLDSDQSLVRIKAYDVLCQKGSAQIFSVPIHSKLNPENEFVLDIINSGGPPLIYCTRIGRPRVAIFGRKVTLQTPAMFSAFDTRLTIASLPQATNVLNVFYRDEGRPNPVQVQSGPDLWELVARLGGAKDDGLHFSYGDIVAILQSMTEKKAVAASFVLQQLPEVAREIQGAPALPESRPQADAAPTGAANNPQIGATLPDLRPAPAPGPAPASGSQQKGQSSPPAVSGRPQ
jgi:flagellar basal body P-ring protein FlgI